MRWQLGSWSRGRAAGLLEAYLRPSFRETIVRGTPTPCIFERHTCRGPLRRLRAGAQRCGGWVYYYRTRVRQLRVRVLAMVGSKARWRCDTGLGPVPSPLCREIVLVGQWLRGLHTWRARCGRAGVVAVAVCGFRGWQNAAANATATTTDGRCVADGLHPSKVAYAPVGAAAGPRPPRGLCVMKPSLPGQAGVRVYVYIYPVDA